MIVIVAAKVGAPVVALIELMRIVCTPAAAAEAVRDKMCGEVEVPLEKLTPPDQSAVVPFVGTVYPFPGDATVPVVATAAEYVVPAAAVGIVV